jgi:hypothetical protein
MQQKHNLSLRAVQTWRHNKDISKVMRIWMKKRILLSKWRTVAVLKANLALTRRKKSFIERALNFEKSQLLKRA